jgi:hypothetical protein
MAVQVLAVIFTKQYVLPYTQLTWSYGTCTADGGDDLVDGNDVDSSQTSSASQDARADGVLGTDVAAADASLAAAVTTADTHASPNNPPPL